MEKETLKIAIAGHVDHGKSTLIGQLLLSTRSLPDDKLKDLERISKEFGKETQLAYLTDQLKEERERNITIDTTEIFLKTPKRTICLIDTPGHLEFIKNMLTGASHADAAVLIVDTNEGVREQTIRHAYLIKLLSLPNVIIVFNKMDLIGYDEDRFQKTKKELEKFLKGLGIEVAFSIPVSAKLSVNVTRPSKEMPWYKGPHLLKALETFQARDLDKRGRLRLPIQDVYTQPDGQIAVGRITSGVLKKGQAVTILPAGGETTVLDIRILGVRRNKALVNESIGVVFSPRGNAVKRGDVIFDGREKVKAATDFTGNIFWLGQEPMKKGSRLTLRCATQEIPCMVERIEKRIDPASLKVLEENGPVLLTNEAGIVRFKLMAPAVVETFLEFPELGRYTVEQNERLLGAGTVLEKE